MTAALCLSDLSQDNVKKLSTDFNETVRKCSWWTKEQTITFWFCFGFQRDFDLWPKSKAKIYEFRYSLNNLITLQRSHPVLSLGYKNITF